jgi:hypothetical protein
MPNKRVVSPVVLIDFPLHRFQQAVQQHQWTQRKSRGPKLLLFGVGTISKLNRIKNS